MVILDKVVRRMLNAKLTKLINQVVPLGKSQWSGELKFPACSLNLTLRVPLLAP